MLSYIWARGSSRSCIGMQRNPTKGFGLMAEDFKRLYRDNGKDNGNYYSILGLYRA